MAQSPPGRGPIFALGIAVATALGTACEPAKSPVGPPGGGPDLSPPIVLLSPSHDTTVDPTGTMLIGVTVHDQSHIKLVDLVASGLPGFIPLVPNDTVFSVAYPITLSALSGTSFAVTARAVDILNHETITGAVIVTVR